MANKNGNDSYSRQTILELPEMSHIQETLGILNEVKSVNPWARSDFWQPIREMPLSAFFDKAPGSMFEGKLNPNLPQLMHDFYGLRIGEFAKVGHMAGHKLQETVNIPSTLSVLKIADEIIEGAEPWADWKQYVRNVPMDSPKVNVPRTRWTDQVGGDIANDTIDIFSEANANAVVLGGKISPVELDVSNTKNSYRGILEVDRNDVKDNNFLAVEQPLKNGGNLFYYLIGKKLISVLTAGTTTNTATKAALDLGTPEHSEFESLSNVIRSKFKGSQLNTADTMFIHPTDAWTTIATAGATGGQWPLLNRFILGPDTQRDVVNNSGLAAALGLRNVWETPQIPQGTVMITKKDVASVVGIREDLTIENFDLTVQGLHQSALVVRFHSKLADENGAYKITGF